MAVPFSELQKIAPSAIIELFQLELNAAQHGVSETHYFHAGTNAVDNGNIVWDGQEYLAWPIEATEFEYSGGALPRPKLKIANVLGAITALIQTLPDGLEGAKVTRVRTLARFLDGVNFPDGVNPFGTPSTDAFPPEIYYVDRKATEGRDLIEYELAAKYDIAGIRLPKRQCVSNVCQWAYRGTECGYVGNAYFNFNDEPEPSAAQDVCGKRLRSCELRFSQVRIPGVVTVGSNVITLDQPVALSTGDPVSGFAIPSGATVASVSGQLVTVSQSATASTSATSAGTISADGRQITLASAAGIVPGMAVTGSYLPPFSQVVAVAGNVVTLSAPVALEQFFTAAWSKAGTAPQYADRDKVYFSDLTTPMVVGQFIASSLLPLSRKAVITSILERRTVLGKSVILQKIATISQSVASGNSAVWTAYTGGTIPSATYTFASTTRNYTFRSSAAIPYGSFPGVGTFFT